MIGWGKVALSVDVHRGARAVCVAIAFRLSPCGGAGLRARPGCGVREGQGGPENRFTLLYMDTVGFSLLTRRYGVAPVGCRGKAQNATGHSYKGSRRHDFRRFFLDSPDHPVTFCCDFVSGNRIVYVARPLVVS